MAATMKGAISFGLLHVPVSLHTATQDNDIHFNQLCREDGSRVKYKKVCAKCGKEVSAQDIVKGFEIEPGKYVILTDEDFEKAKVQKDKTIHILHFADIHDIRPIYFDKTYHAVPEAGGDKAYELLRRCMLEEHTVAIAKGVIGPVGASAGTDPHRYRHPGGNPVFQRRGESHTQGTGQAGAVGAGDFHGKNHYRQHEGSL